MLLKHSEPFSFEDKHYTINVYSVENGYFVKALLGDRPANPYRYCVDIETEIDFINKNNFSVIYHLIDIAKSDIKSKMWEKYFLSSKE